MKKIFSIPYICLLALFLIAAVFSLQPSNFFYNDFKIGDYSNSEIIAPKSVTYIDEEATEELKKDARESVQVKYDLDQSKYQSISNDITLFFDSLIVFKENKEEPNPKNNKNIYSTIKNPFSLSEDDITLFLSLEKSEIKRMQDYFTKETDKIFSSGITKENVEQLKSDFQNNAVLSFFNKNAREIIIPKIANRFEPNLSINEKETEKAKEEIVATVNPVYKKITKDDIVVRKNEEITKEHIEKLENLQLINTDYSIKDFLSHIPNILLILILFHLYCFKFHAQQISSFRRYSLVYVATLLVLVLNQAHFLQDTFWSFTPFLISMIIFVVFYGRQFVVPASVFVGYLLNGDDFLYLLLCILIGLSLSVLYKEIKRFIDAILLGLFLGLILSVSQGILFFSFDMPFQLTSSLSLVMSGVVAGAFASGIIPFVEKMTGSATIYILTELNKYDHPILEEMFQKARGTYEHSRNVAHLVSVASNRIGTNTLLLKVAALYHDLGKIKHPSFFIENSNPTDNIHNYIDPRESARVIREHPLESVRLCRKHNIPEEVIQLIECHHGDSTLKHFYSKAVSKDPDSNITDFQYTTPLPKSKEEGVLLLADSVEAFSRTLNKGSEEELDHSIRKLVYGKISEGTLRECELTLHEIDMCINEFVVALHANDHVRVPYITNNNES